MFSLLLIVAMLHAGPFPERVQEAYAQEDTTALRSLLQTADTRSDSFLVRYRLYPLTENGALVDDLPNTLPSGATARTWALLSGLWSYRAGEASVFNAVSYGRRSARVLKKARSIDPDNPYVLLVEGQSLLFRPAIAGKDAQGAAQRFATLAQLAENGKTDGIPPIEANVWRWLALKEAGRTQEANALYEKLRAQSPAPLYRQFLEDPPEV